MYRERHKVPRQSVDRLIDTIDIYKLAVLAMTAPPSGIVSERQQIEAALGLGAKERGVCRPARLKAEGASGARKSPSSGGSAGLASRLLQSRNARSQPA